LDSVLVVDGSWETIEPKVSSEEEFKEIASDFGDPLEIVREAISNAFDANATTLRILFDVQEIDGLPTLVIEFEDNGDGMSKQTLRDAFWGLGYSTSRQYNENTAVRL
jgi:sensor histidine kinase regulating citrate/malate metabolism